MGIASAIGGFFLWGVGGIDILSCWGMTMAHARDLPWALIFYVQKNV